MKASIQQWARWDTAVLICDTWKMELMNSEDRKSRYQQSYSLSAAAGTTKKRMVIIAALWRVSEDLRKELTSVDTEHSLCSAHQLKYLWMKVRCGLSKLQSPDCLQNTLEEEHSQAELQPDCVCVGQKCDTVNSVWWGWAQPYAGALLLITALSHRTCDVRLPGCASLTCWAANNRKPAEVC